LAYNFFGTVFWTFFNGFYRHKILRFAIPPSTVDSNFVLLVLLLFSKFWSQMRQKRVKKKNNAFYKRALFKFGIHICLAILHFLKKIKITAPNYIKPNENFIQ
jgi:hypothetical protein